MARTLIGAKVRERRKALGLTQAELALRAGISASYLNLIEGNRRNIGGALLQRIAEVLQVPVGRFDGAAERRLVDELAELALDPLVAQPALAPAEAADLVARHPAWAHALVSLHRSHLDRGEAVAALSDRLGQDPRLGDAVHSLLTHVAAIRSAAEILESDAELEAAQRRRFIAIVAGDSRRLSQVSQALASFFGTHARTRSITPAEQVDDFIIGSDNHFPALEAAADRLRAAAGLMPGRSEAALADHLASAHGVALRRAEALAGGALPRLSFDRAANTLTLPELAPEPSRCFHLARLAAELGAGAAIHTEIAGTPALATAVARQRAAEALASYVAAAMLMPYDAFLDAAQAARYDIDFLARRFGVSYEQACHRLATLRRRGREGVRFGFLRADAAGHAQKRFPLPRLPLPRYGSACPLWPVYGAFQQPGATLRRLVEMPGGERYLMFARAVDKERPAAGLPRHLMSIMLVCDAMNADQLVYGDGLDRSPDGPRTPVGQACRVCVRRGCAYRQEAPIVEARPAPDAGAERVHGASD